MKRKMNELKVGEKVLLIKSRNSISKYEGQIAEIMSKSGGNLYVRFKDGSNYTLYPNDEYCLADRSSIIKRNKELIENLKKEIEVLQKDTKRLEMFKDDAEEVAYKLDLLLKAKSKDKMAEILRTLKETNFI